MGFNMIAKPTFTRRATSSSKQERALGEEQSSSKGVHNFYASQY